MKYGVAEYGTFKYGDLHSGEYEVAVYRVLPRFSVDIRVEDESMAGKDGKWDRGSTILVEVEFKRQAPFGSLTLFDPTDPTITVTDEDGTVVINAQDLLQSSTGQWYFNVQTLEAWIEGNYRVKIDSTDGSESDVTIEPRLFRLV